MGHSSSIAGALSYNLLGCPNCFEHSQRTAAICQLSISSFLCWPANLVGDRSFELLTPAETLYLLATPGMREL